METKSRGRACAAHQRSWREKGPRSRVPPGVPRFGALDSLGGLAYFGASRWHSINVSANSFFHFSFLADRPLRPTRHNMAKRNFRPLHDRVVVKRIDAEEKTKGGIIIPDTAKEKPSQGEVIAVGPGGRDESGKLTPIDVKVGDRVLFGKWSGTEVVLDGEDLLIMKESDIMGVVA
jgi:chaperonin GroES